MPFLKTQENGQITDLFGIIDYTQVFQGTLVLTFTSKRYPKRANNFLYSTYQKCPFSMSPALLVQLSYLSVQVLENLKKKGK